MTEELASYERRLNHEMVVQETNKGEVKAIRDSECRVRKELEKEKHLQKKICGA